MANEQSHSLHLPLLMLPIMASEQAQVANTLKPTEIQFLRQYLASLELMNLASVRHLVMWYAGGEMVVWQVMDSGFHMDRI